MRATILGLGNVLCGDDGFGSHAVQMLRENWRLGASCDVIDGGTQAQLLAGIVEESDSLLIIDAVDFGLEPGSLALRQNDAIPAWLAKAKLSAHQCSFAETLALAQLRGRKPAEIVLIGFQAVNIEFGASLSPAARNALPRAISLALNWLENRGISCERCSSTPEPAVAELRGAFLGGSGQ